MKEGDDPRTMEINNLDLWVQLHGMNAGFMSQRVVTDVGNYIGKFLESDTNNFMGVWREYLRVRVTIDLTKPLKRRMKLRKSQTNWCWVNFRYEGIPTFCFICGMIGHGEKFCEKIFDTPVEQIEKPYGAWMKAEPRRRSHTMGAKWLRQGGKNPVEFPAERTEDDGRKVVTTEDAVNDQNPDNLGNRTDVQIIPKQTGMGGKHGEGDFSGEIVSQINTVSTVLITKEYADLNENLGPQGIVQKRRRIEEPNDSGPSRQNNTEEIDTDMTDEAQLGALVSKNGVMAVSARQTRQSL
ncbi:hypothetical protein POM88_027515 [Heracleum sosnowskyi]|uniref:Zinc knuckle CX2CX4HX4C domain-containing protein n=1 Tax=Heracleum sosnowskyi TaxID=360622 RepID=A0AAD8I946_9APIA|nr:hypothetical protein POM88_027515 [Heracleum sosnowskyi]